MCDFCDGKLQIQGDGFRYSIPHKGTLMVTTENREYLTDVQYCIKCGYRMDDYAYRPHGVCLCERSGRHFTSIGSNNKADIFIYNKDNPEKYLVLHGDDGLEIEIPCKFCPLCGTSI